MNDFLAFVLLHVAALGLVAILYATRLFAHYGRWTFPAHEVPAFAVSYLVASGMGLMPMFSTGASAVPLLGGFAAVNAVVLLCAYLVTRAASSALRAKAGMPSGL